MENNTHSHQAGFSRVDAGLLLIVILLASLTSYLTDRIFRSGENLKHLLGWLEETHAKLKRGVTADYLRDLMGTNLHNKTDWEFVAIGCAVFTLALALLLGFSMVRRFRRHRLARLAKAQHMQSRNNSKPVPARRRRAVYET